MNMLKAGIAALLLCIAAPAIAQQGTQAEQLADLHTACASVVARADTSGFDTDWDTSYLRYERETLEAAASRISLNPSDLNFPVSVCFARRRLAQLNGAPLLKTGTTGSHAIASRPNVAAKTQPPRSTAAAKLPPARPVQTAPWSPRAMPINPKETLDPKYAAERTDALASCSVPIREFGATHPGTPLGSIVLVAEGKDLFDGAMSATVEKVRNRVATLDAAISSGNLDPGRLAGYRLARCIFARCVAQLEGSPLIPGAVDGTLNPLSIVGPAPPWKQQGKDAHVIAGNGKSAMHCVSLETIASGDSNTSGAVARRVLVSHCADEVGFIWCNSPGNCETETGSAWNLRPGGSWPIGGDGEVRWAACHGRDTASTVRGSYGLRYYCSAPAVKPKG